MRPLLPCCLLLLVGCAERVELPVAVPRDDPTEDWAALLDRAIVDGRVDYDLIEQERETLHRYLAWVGEHGPEMDGIRESHEDERISFLVNAYNAAVIEGVLRNRPIGSVLDAGEGIWDLKPGLGFFLGQRFKVDGDWQSLYVLEHQGIVGRYQEPLVHVALNCASRGCPPLRFWEKKNLQNEMGDAMAAWLAGDALVCDAGGCRASEIFFWYEDDFLDWGLSGNLCEYLSWYAEGEELRWLEENLEGCPLGRIPYDWGLNALEG